MRQSLSQAGFICALLVSSIHCDTGSTLQDQTPPISPEGLEFLDSIVGRWKVSGPLNDTCPEDASVPFPLGETRWERQGDDLGIEGASDQDIALSLIPIDERTFSRTAEATWNSCGAIQTITVTITNLSDDVMQGTFSAITEVEDGVFCPAELDTSDFPCETSVTWTALRL